MRYSRTRNSFLTGSVWPAGLALALLVLIFVVLRLFAPQALIAVSAPLWGAGNAVTGAVGMASLPFADVAKLRAERDALLQENDALRAETATQKAQLADLGLLGAPAGYIRAGVLNRPPVTPYDTLVVGAGVRDGVTDGVYAYGPGGTPVGRVAGVADTSSRIELFSLPTQETEGWVGANRLPITLIGRGAGAFEAALPRDTSVAVGDIVYLPGPGALPIGTVLRIDSDPSSPRAVIHVQPIVNPSSLTWVSIAR
jgi:cell shape-determining protein MreC